LPDPSRRAARLPVIPGGVPNPDAVITGCRFADRCPLADESCRKAEPDLVEIEPGHLAACFKAGR
jgi:oligopeptide/dipeptide ABC transporter ATP-binding protein